MIGDILSQGRESKAHHSAKHAVADMIENGPGYLLASIESDGRWETYVMPTEYCKVVVECAYPQGIAVQNAHDFCAQYGHYPHMIIDVGLVWDGCVVGGVEIMKSHWLDERKIGKIQDAKVVIAAVTADLRVWRQDRTRLDCRYLLNRHLLHKQGVFP